MKKATRQQSKEHNRSLVLKTIFETEAVSRAEIARQTSLTRTTISEIVSELLEAGLVDEIGVGESQGGKSPILLGLLPNSRYMLGLNLADNKFSGAIVNLGGEICEYYSVPFDACDGEIALQTVYVIIERLLQSDYQPVIGIGVGTPGLINTCDGIVVNAVNLEWKDLPLARIIQRRYHLPVYILNDSHAAAIGEFTYGAGRTSDHNLVVVNAGHGIGSGIMINGHLFSGDGGGAGEIGHINVVREGGLPCRCGQTGCLETVASAGALRQRARELSGDYPGSSLSINPREITLERLELAFQAGDPLARTAVFETADYLGIGIANLVGILNIQQVVLVGEMTRFGDLWLRRIQQTVEEMSLPGLADATRIEIGLLGDNRTILGAAARLLEDYSLLFDPGQMIEEGALQLNYAQS